MWKFIFFIAFLCACHWCATNLDFDTISKTTIQKGRTDQTVNFINSRRQEQAERVKKVLGY